LIIIVVKLQQAFNHQLLACAGPGSGSSRHYSTP
jgi:hypothetical protein